MNENEILKSFKITEDEMERIGQEYENDTWDERALTNVTVGRPALSSEPTKTMSFKIEQSTYKAVDNKASLLGISKSEYVRKLIDRDLLQI